ncbi:odorant receptor 49a-like [Cylas formicarius]|uniref:odorant receptor 49a-like n=1 Tax=Cylas formicarius TaxID=197179 RepID=UPI002958656E|nr:odorant receptor 49a-like [Cylas formicarius]
MTETKELFEVTRWAMIASGIWRLEIPKANSMIKKLYFLYSIVTQIIFDTSIIMFNMEFIKLYGVHTDQAIENLSRMIFVLLLIVKFSICQTTEMKTLLRKALEGERKIFTSNSKTIINIYSTHAWYFKMLILAMAVATFMLAVYLSEIGISEAYEFHKTHQDFNGSVEAAFPVALWYPFDRNQHFIFVLCHQTLEICLTGLYTVSVNAFTNSMMIYLRAELKILQYCFKHFGNYRIKPDIFDGENVSLYLLKMFGRQHQRLIIWTEDLNSTFQKLIFLEYGVASLLLAAVIFQIFAGIRVIFNSIYFVLVSCQLMALAWNANEILIQSENLASALYNSNWYDQNQRTKVLVRIIMLRCQKPLTISIGPFGAMTTNAVLSRFKLAYSYLSVMSPGSK